MSTCFSSVLSPTKTYSLPESSCSLSPSVKRESPFWQTLHFYFSVLIAAVYTECPVLYLPLFNMMFLVGIQPCCVEFIYAEYTVCIMWLSEYIPHINSLILVVCSLGLQNYMYSMNFDEHLSGLLRLGVNRPLFLLIIITKILVKIFLSPIFSRDTFGKFFRNVITT